MNIAETFQNKENDIHDTSVNSAPVYTVENLRKTCVLLQENMTIRKRALVFFKVASRP